MFLPAKPLFIGKINQPLCCWGRIFLSEILGQLNDNWCSSSLRHQVIGNHVIDHLGYTCPCISCERFSMPCTISMSRNVRNVNISYFSWQIFPHLKGYIKHQSIGHMVDSYLPPTSQTSFVNCGFSYRHGMVTDQDWRLFETMHYLCWTAKSSSLSITLRSTNFSRKSYLSITLRTTNSYRYLYYFIPHIYTYM